MPVAPLPTTPANDRAARPLTGLVSDLVQEASTLIRKEVELARVEIEEKASLFLGGLQRTAIGGGLLFAGLLFVLAAAALALALVLPLWAATLIVGTAVATIGWIIVRSGRRDLSLETLQPERTLRSLAKDKAWAQSHLSERNSSASTPF